MWPSHDTVISHPLSPCYSSCLLRTHPSRPWSRDAKAALTQFSSWRYPSDYRRIEATHKSSLVRFCSMIYFNVNLSTYDHRVWRTGLPVRSAVLKPHAGALVVTAHEDT
ncbi:hypothetical protein N7507_006592 [Penicillium longicatenatum]|nr:hypothetical protein N7507_006592 [Penicillium longicatenatum]